MIFIQKNSSNDVYLTLRESSSVASNSTGVTYYLFNFKSVQTQQDLYFCPVPISSVTRYDSFRIIESGLTAVSLTGGTINLAPNYFFDYYIYEQSSLANQYNLYLTGTTGTIIEQGKVLVSGGTYGTTYIRYNDSGQTQTQINSISVTGGQPTTKRITYNG